MAVKLEDPETRRMIDEELARRDAIRSAPADEP